LAGFIRKADLFFVPVELYKPVDEPGQHQQAIYPAEYPAFIGHQRRQAAQRVNRHVQHDGVADPVGTDIDIPQREAEEKRIKHLRKIAVDQRERKRRDGHGGALPIAAQPVNQQPTKEKLLDNGCGQHHEHRGSPNVRGGNELR